MTRRAARSPTRRASRSLERPIANPATITAKTARPTNAAISNVRFRPPSAARPATARIGKPRITNWFQTLVTTTASPTGRPLKPHARSIAIVVAMPTAAPPGAIEDSAVDASVTRDAWK